MFRILASRSAGQVCPPARLPASSRYCSCFRNWHVNCTAAGLRPVVLPKIQSRTSAMRKNDPVSHVMTKDPVVLEAGDSLSRARRLFEETGVHHLPVVRGGELAGILLCQWRGPRCGRNSQPGWLPLRPRCRWHTTGRHRNLLRPHPLSCRTVRTLVRRH